MPGPYPGSDVFPTTTDIPSDGDKIDGTSVNVPFEAALDRTIWLRNRILPGTYGTASTATLETFSTTSYVAASTLMVDIVDCVIGDTFLIDLQCRASSSPVGAPGIGYLDIIVVNDFGGANSPVAVFGTERVVENTAAPVANSHNLSISTLVPISTDGPARVILYGKVSAVGAVLYVSGPAMLRVIKVRL